MKLELLTRAENMQLLFSDMESLISECKSSEELKLLQETFLEEHKIVSSYFDKALEALEIEG